MNTIHVTRSQATPLTPADLPGRWATGLGSKLSAVGAEIGDCLRLTVQSFRFSHYAPEDTSANGAATTNRLDDLVRSSAGLLSIR